MPASEEVQTEVAERRAKAVQLRIAGASLDEIAAALLYGGSTPESRRAAVSKDLRRAFEAARDVQINTAMEWRELELSRLDRIQRGLWPHAITGDTKAAHAVLQVMDRRARLLGLDAAVKVNNLWTEPPLPDSEVMQLIQRAHDQAVQAGRQLQLGDGELEP